MLCPLPIVYALQLETAQEIQELFFISRQAAENRWNEYLLYRNKKEISLLDRQIQKHFSLYIEQTQRRLIQTRYQQNQKYTNDIIRIE